MYIIDADKLLEFVEAGMLHSRLCAKGEPINLNGEYDPLFDMIKRMDLFTYNQLKLVRDYIIKNRVMKELSIEEKAKRYDEAIKKLEDIKTGKCQKTFIFTEGLFEYIFPELAESEDERIRKTLIEFFSRGAECNSSTNGIPDKDIITWLEKQEEIKIPKWIFDFLEECRPYIGCALGYDERRDIDGKVVAVQKWLEKQGEQKPADKIEQEYHCTGMREPKEATGVLKQLIDEQKSAWSEEDENEYVHILKIINLVAKEQETKGYNNLNSSIKWLKHLKDRVQSKPVSSPVFK